MSHHYEASAFWNIAFPHSPDQGITLFIPKFPIGFVAESSLESKDQFHDLTNQR